MRGNQAITLQMNVTTKVGFADGSTETYHIHSGQPNISLNSESENRWEIRSVILMILLINQILKTHPYTKDRT